MFFLLGELLIGIATGELGGRWITVVDRRLNNNASITQVTCEHN